MVINGLECTFDTVASVYEKFRPGYPEELYKTIFDHIALNESCHAVEIGIGGGMFARFANHPYRAKDDSALAAEMDRIYAEYYYPFQSLPCRQNTVRNRRYSGQKPQKNTVSPISDTPCSTGRVPFPQANTAYCSEPIPTTLR